MVHKYPNTYDVVISHHGPSPMSLPVNNPKEMVSAAYVSRLESVINDYQPAIWVHGHLHNSSDYHIGSCQVICNPRGYPGERNPEFREALIVEV